MSPSSIFRCALLSALLLVCLATTAEAAPFFDAIYAALNGNGRRSYPSSYGYGGYNSGYSNGYNGGYGYNRGGGYGEAPKRQGKSYRDICRVHNPQSWQSACPWN